MIDKVKLIEKFLSEGWSGRVVKIVENFAEEPEIDFDRLRNKFGEEKCNEADCHLPMCNKIECYTNFLKSKHLSAPAQKPEQYFDSVEPERGLYKKYYVERTDGKSANGEKHEKCKYFVIDIDHDKFAGAALLEYADRCKDDHPELSHLECVKIAMAKMAAPKKFEIPTKKTWTLKKEYEDFCSEFLIQSVKTVTDVNPVGPSAQYYDLHEEPDYSKIPKDGIVTGKQIGRAHV